MSFNIHRGGGVTDRHTDRRTDGQTTLLNQFSERGAVVGCRDMQMRGSIPAHTKRSEISAAKLSEMLSLVILAQKIFQKF